MRFAQLTPPGSGCSIVLGGEQAHGAGLAEGPAARRRRRLSWRANNCVERGVDAGEIDVIDERDGGTLFGFADPDGNGWVVQQIKARADRPLIPR